MPRLRHHSFSRYFSSLHMRQRPAEPIPRTSGLRDAPAGPRAATVRRIALLACAGIRAHTQRLICRPSACVAFHRVPRWPCPRHCSLQTHGPNTPLRVTIHTADHTCNVLIYCCCRARCPGPRACLLWPPQEMHHGGYHCLQQPI